MSKEFFQKIGCIFLIALVLLCGVLFIERYIKITKSDTTNTTETTDFELLTATIIEEVSDNTLIVHPVKDEWELNSSDKIVAYKDWADESIRSMLKIGTVVVIKYDGQIMESYPAQINADEMWIKSVDLY